MSLPQLIGNLRKPETAEQQRHRQIALAAISSLISRASALLLAYLSVSLVVNKMGATNFGIWMAINSLGVLLPFADFGLGNGLISYVSRLIGEHAIEQIPSAVAACLYVMLAAGALVSLSGMALSESGMLRHILKGQTPQTSAEIALASATFFVCLGITLPLTLVEKVQMASQDAHLTSLWQICANILTCLTVCYVSTRSNSLFFFVLAYSGTPLITKAANFFSYFRRKSHLAPSLRKVDWRTGRHLLKCGVSFVLLQSSVAIGYTCDNLILASQSGPIAVATYDVVQRLFSLTVLTELSIGPLWGAFGEAMGRGDFEWVRKTFYRSIRFNGLLCAAICICLVLAGPTLVRLWTNGRIHPELSLLLAFSAWRLMNVVQGNLSVLLNHEATLRQQTIYFVVAAITSFMLKIPLLAIFGRSGVIIATVVSFSLLYILPGLRIVKRLFADHRLAREGDLVAA